MTEARHLPYGQGGPRSASVEAFLNTLEEWFGAAGFSDVEMDVTHPTDDEISDIRNLEAIVRFRPALATSAAFEILVCGGSGPVGIGMAIESWERLESRDDLPLTRIRGKPYAAMARQPVTNFTPSIALTVCDAVANGKIDIQIAIVRGAIAGCWGSVPVEGDRDMCIELGIGPFFAGLLERLSIARIMRVRFDPWPRHSVTQ